MIERGGDKLMVYGTFPPICMLSRESSSEVKLHSDL